MKSQPDCLPCFLRQATYAGKLATSDPVLQAAILDQTRLYLSDLGMENSPPVNSIGLYRLISQISGNPDPFLALKQQSNELALRLRPHVQEIIAGSDDPVFTAILFAIAGNIIDYGSQQDFDLNQTIDRCLTNTLVINDYAALRQELAQARTILYLADNCGELVFDGLLIDQLPPNVTIAVKQGPIINDATMADALLCGLDKKCRIISNGATCPGTPLGKCSPEFEKLFREADVVISKGQGDFETLSEVKRPIFHLLTIKCPVVGAHAAEAKNIPGLIQTGSAILMRLGDLTYTNHRS